jgi:hypothetical protein
VSTRTANKLLARAHDTQHGWTAKELIKLYKSFGFIILAGSRHDLAKHHLLIDGKKATITRSSGEIHPDYVKTAIELIEFVQSQKED